MRIYKLAWLYLPAILLFFSCNGGGFRVKGNGDLVTQERPATNFEQVDLKGSMDLVISNGPYKVEVEAESNLQQYLRTEMEGNKLVIGWKPNMNIRTNRTVRVYVQAPDLEEVSLRGSGSVESKGMLKTGNDFRLDLTGSGDVQLEIDAPKVRIDQTGSGSIRLKGRTRDLDLESKGSGDIEADDLLAENTRVDALGSGSIRVHASYKLDIDARGSGDIYYRGSPQVSSNMKGSGSLQKID